MRVCPGLIVMLTGASGGLGTYMAHALASRGVKLALVAHPGAELQKLRQALEKKGCLSLQYNTDLRESRKRNELVAQVNEDLGPIDILINNAGVEFTSIYHELSEAQVDEVLKVNLEAPMMLSRLVLPQMLERKFGHIVNIASLAGKSGPACQEAYAATKAGLIAFTASLRATYRGTGVSASVITPGFAEAGIYTRLKETVGRSAPALLGSSSPERVADALLKAVEYNKPEIIVNPIPVRPLFALCALFPRTGEWVIDRIGANQFFLKAADALKRQNSS